MRRRLAGGLLVAMVVVVVVEAVAIGQAVDRPGAAVTASRPERGGAVQLTPVPGPLSGAVAAVAGDSLSLDVYEELVPALAATGPSVLDAWIGRGLTVAGWMEQVTGLDALERVVPQLRDGAALVVELGTNDVLQGGDATSYRQAIRQAVALIPAWVHLSWVNVYDGRHLDRTAVFNQVLAEEVARRPGARVLDWWSRVVADPSLVLPAPDLVHLTPAGHDDFLEVLRDGFARGPSSP